MRSRSPRKSQVVSVALWCSPSLNTTASHYKAFRVSSLAQHLRQLGDIRRNPSRLISAEQLGRCWLPCIVVIDVRERLPSAVLDDEASDLQRSMVVASGEGRACSHLSG